jgi:hypothetical protein
MRVGASVAAARLRPVAWLLGAVLLVAVVPACGRAGLTARIVLPTSTVRTGSIIHGELVVNNETGETVIVATCGTPFVVALANDAYQPAIFWPRCLQHVPIPVGESTWRVDIRATYLACQGEASPAVPPEPQCVNGNVPPLPVGIYRATLYQDPPRVVADPYPILVTVTP